MTDIKIPDDLWEEEREGVVVSWIYQDGAVVQAGKVLVELMVEKAQLELAAPAGGRLKILAPADSLVVRGQVIGRIE